MEKSLYVCELFLSLQGEGRHIGLPCIFIRLTGCPLRCSYCDTTYAFKEGKKMSISEILSKIKQLSDLYSAEEGGYGKLPLVEVTGGEPLVQKNTPQLLEQLLQAGFKVLLETSGAISIREVPIHVYKIVDIKCPSSGESDSFVWENLDYLNPFNDEIKFVIQTQQDYYWAVELINKHALDRRFQILFSWAWPPKEDLSQLKTLPQGHIKISYQWLAERILQDRLPVRFQLQLHRMIWPQETRGR